MNTNVSDMPIEIFADYTADMLDQEWDWTYIVPTLNDNGVANEYVNNFGSGSGYMSHYSGSLDLPRFQVNCSEP